jgi:hypothetical protein
MIGRVEETSASFEARSAPRLYPTERLGVKFPGPTRQKQALFAPRGTMRQAPEGWMVWLSWQLAKAFARAAVLLTICGVLLVCII